MFLCDSSSSNCSSCRIDATKNNIYGCFSSRTAFLCINVIYIYIHRVIKWILESRVTAQDKKKKKKRGKADVTLFLLISYFLSLEKKSNCKVHRFFFLWYRVFFPMGKFFFASRNNKVEKDGLTKVKPDEIFSDFCKCDCFCSARVGEDLIFFFILKI